MSNAHQIPAHDPFQQQSEDFLSWLTAQSGVTVNPNIKIEDLRPLGAGRGVVAVNEITEGDDLFTIPREIILSVKNSDLNDYLAAKLEVLGPWLSLMVVMMYEYLIGENSRWFSYFQILPSTFDTLMFWDEKQLSELQASAIVDKIGKTAANQSILDTVVPLIRSNPSLFRPIDGLSSWESDAGTDALLQLAHRMGSLIMAYSFDIDKTEEEETPDEDGFLTDEEDQPAKGMVPLADLLNADANLNNAILFQEESFFVMRATKRIEASEQIFNDYGEIPRSDLLRRYGYVTDKYAPYDVVELPLQLICQVAGLDDAEPEHQTQLKLLHDLGILEDGYCVQRPSAEDTLIDILPDELLALIKTLTLTPEQLLTQRSRNKPPQPTLAASEAKLLLKAIQKRSAQYASSIEEDCGFLNHLQQNDASNHRREMAIKVRIGEKDILRQLSFMLSEYLEHDSTQTIPTKRRADDDAGSNLGKSKAKKSN